MQVSPQLMPCGDTHINGRQDMKYSQNAKGERELTWKQSWKLPPKVTTIFHSSQTRYTTRSMNIWYEI